MKSMQNNMKMLRKITAIFLLNFLTVTLVQGREHMQEQPTFFKDCFTTEPDFNDCCRNNLQALVFNFKDGIPGFPSVGKFDPARLKKLRVVQDSLKVELRKISVAGLGDTQVTDAKVNTTDYSFKLKITVPKVHIDSIYKVDGRIMFLPLNGKGKLTLDAGNLSLTALVKMDLVNDAGVTFADIKEINTKIRHIGDFHINMENLFNGNKMLETETNAIFNENWRDFVGFLRPALEEGINSIVLRRFKKMFQYIPAKYFIANVAKGRDINAEEAQEAQE